MSPARRVAIMLQMDWPYKRHTDIFVGVQRWAEKRGWETIFDEYVDDSLAAGLPYDGVIARATPELAREAARRGVPVVNVLFSSPVAHELPGVFPDWASFGRIYAEHLLERGAQRFAALMDRGNRAQQVALAAFRETLAGANRDLIVGIAPRNFSQTRRR